MLIKGGGRVDIGRYCAFGDSIRFITSNHDIHGVSVQYYLQKQIVGIPRVNDARKNIRIGHDVWIGDAVIVLPGVNVGNGAVIGAGSVVTRSVDSYSIVAGNPARKIGERFAPLMRETLELISWWDWPPDKLYQQKTLFSVNMTNFNEDEIWKLIE